MSKQNRSVVTSQSNQLATPISAGEWAQRDLSDFLPDVVAHFLLSLRSDHTRRNYARDLQEFIEFLRLQLGINIQSIKEITEKMVMLWNQQLNNQHSQYVGSRARVIQSSVARKLCSLSSLLNFAKKRRLIDVNCMDLLSRPKIKRESKTNALTADELKSILSLAELDAMASKDVSLIKYRSAKLRYAVLFTLLSVGMRVDELCELRIGDFEQTPQFSRLHMTAKGGETHSPIIHENTVAVLQAYISEFRAHASQHDLLFVRAHRTKVENKLSQVAIYDMITALAARANIEKKVSPHSCRATLATLLHHSGVPIGQIQDLLNHKQITTTAIYIKKANEVDEAAATKIDILS